MVSGMHLRYNFSLSELIWSGMGILSAIFGSIHALWLREWWCFSAEFMWVNFDSFSFLCRGKCLAHFHFIWLLRERKSKSQRKSKSKNEHEVGCFTSNFENEVLLLWAHHYEFSHQSLLLLNFCLWINATTSWGTVHFEFFYCCFFNQLDRLVLNHSWRCLFVSFNWPRFEFSIFRTYTHLTMFQWWIINIQFNDDDWQSICIVHSDCVCVFLLIESDWFHSLQSSCAQFYI